MPLQFTYSERCHYNSFEPSNMPFYTYLILLDPRAGSGIFVWTKMPLLPLHPPLTYLWAPHVSFFFFFPSPAAVAALHPQALARTPRPCARAPAASSEVEKTAVVGAAPAPAPAPESPPASRARWRGYLMTVTPPSPCTNGSYGSSRRSSPPLEAAATSSPFSASLSRRSSSSLAGPWDPTASPALSRPSGAGPARPSRAGVRGAERRRTGQAQNGEAAWSSNGAGPARSQRARGGDNHELDGVSRAELLAEPEHLGWACRTRTSWSPPAPPWHGGSGQFQRRRSVRAHSAAQASPGAAPFGVHARAPPRRSGSAPELGVLHRQRPSAPPRRARPCGAPPPKSARARRRCGPALAGAADTPAPPSGARARRRRARHEQRRAAPAGRRSWRREDGAGTRREDSPASGRLRARARRPRRQVQAPAWG